MVRLGFPLRFILVLALLCAASFSASLFDNPPSKAAPFQSGEYVITYAGDCVTPQTVFHLGDTVCAEAGGFPLALSSRYRRFVWASPDSSVADLTNIRVDPQFDKFVIPTSGQFAQIGTWYVRTINPSSEGHTSAKFFVRNPRLPFVNMWITKNGPHRVLPEEKLIYRVEIGNPGPDFAEGVELVTEVPSNMIFVGLKQLAGPEFECVTPEGGGTGRIVCNTKGLDLDEKAGFDLYYQVSRDVREGMACSGVSFVSSRTEEGHKDDNSWATEALVTSPDQEDPGPGEPEP